MIFAVSRFIVAAAGVALVGYGAWLHYPPLGFVIGGLMLFGPALIGALRAGRA